MEGGGDIRVGFSGIIERRGHDHGEKRSCNSKGFFFIDNSNVDENILNKSLLNLNRYGNRHFFRKFHKYIKGLLTYWYVYKYADITKHLSTANTDISRILKWLRLSNPKSVILSYLNVNKFGNLREIIVAETKIDASFPSAQFFFEGYRSLYRFESSRKSCGLLVLVKATIPSRQLSLPKFQFRIPVSLFD